MKKAITFLALILFLSNSMLEAQNPIRPNSLVFKKLWIDYHTPQNGEFSTFDDLTDGLEIAYLRNLNKSLNVAIPLKLGVIHLPGQNNNLTTLGVDGVAQVQFFKEENFLVPYLMGGIGTVIEEFDNVNFQIPVGGGINIRLGRFAYATLQTEFRKSLSDDRDNLQHGLGLTFMIGSTGEEELPVAPPEVTGPADKDGDGLADTEDQCPDQPGPAALAGCPDTDGDGITDSKDQCPEDAGTLVAKGCPDRDQDGLPDPEDECPDEYGAVRGCPDSDRDGLIDKIDECPQVYGNLRGCPDTDGDGVEDKTDPCPRVPGPLNTNGCPDTDNDGLDDSQDRCPNTAGPAANNGCPEIKQEDKTVLDYALQAVRFETGSQVLKNESFTVLDQIVDIMNRYPDFHLSIIGHTDNVGTEDRNQNLSVRRARSCYDFLISRGVAAHRISYGGFGETRPIADNSTPDGRQLNRRVEFNLGPKEF